MFKQLFMEENNGSNGGGGAGTINIGADGGGQAPTSANTGAAGSSSAEGTSGATGSSWISSLPEDIRQDPSLQMFKDPAALAKSYVNAQKMIGADKVIIPNEKSTDQEWEMFYNKVGRPESAEKYDIKPPDGLPMDEKFLGGFKEVAHKTGLTAKQVASVFDWYAKETKSSLDNSQASQVAEMNSALDEYKTSLGGEEKFKSTVDKASAAVRELATPELKKFLIDTGAGSHPAMIGFFARVAGMMSEDKIKDGTGTRFTEDATTLEAQLAQLVDDPKSDLYNMDSHDRRQAAIQKSMILRERLNHIRSRV